jgi:branched-chain amino acid transport system ATP-binding protein
MSLLALEHLDLRHGLLQAVRDVSFTVASGQILALVGANGAGKTTLLRAIAGAHRPNGGRVLLDGKDITDVPSHNRVGLGIALVPEGRRLFVDMTVEENLLLAKSVGRKGPWNMDTIMEAFPNLKGRRHHRAGLLSGGEQQATAIGRALMTNPDILLIDEVLAVGDARFTEKSRARIDEFKKSGTTIVLATHDLSTVETWCQQALYLCGGKIGALGEPKEVVAKYKQIALGGN